MENFIKNFDQKALERFKDFLSVPSKIVVVSHSNPDGDAVGSALATAFLLEKLGHQLSIILPNSFPDFLAWLPRSQSILMYDREEAAVRSAFDACDIIVCVDFNSPGRVSEMEAVLRNAKAKKILIDHHLEPDSSFDVIISVINVSSTSELIYHLFDALGFSGLFDKAISECLYTGIMTDTGSFSYACSYVPTFLVAAQLLRQGIDPEKIHRLVYDTYSESRMRLIGHCLSERLVVLPAFGTAYIYLSAADLVLFDYQVGDTEGLVNYALAIKGIQFAAFFTEKDDHIRISLRSKGEFSVNEFSRKHYKGGGHRNAAGGNSYVSLEKTLIQFEELLPLYAKKLNY